MKKSVFFLLLQGYALKFVMSELSIEVTSSSCGDFYDMNDVDDHEVYVTYSGARLNNDECSVQFLNYRTFESQTCVKPLNLRLGCSTNVEYYRHFISEYLDPVRRFSCGNTALDEYCGPTRTNVLYIVFRTSWDSADDYASLHVYLKRLPEEPDPWDDNSSSSSVLVVLPVLAVVFVIIVSVLLIACKIAQRRRMQMPRTPYAYQTTGGPVITQTGQGNVTPAQPMTGYNPQQQPPFQPAAPGNYQMHPMRSAYPVTQQQGYSTGTGYLPVGQTDSGPHSPAGSQHPSAPPPPTAYRDEPPSYEMATK